MFFRREIPSHSRKIPPPTQTPGERERAKALSQKNRARRHARRIWDVLAPCTVDCNVFRKNPLTRKIPPPTQPPGEHERAKALSQKNRARRPVRRARVLIFAPGNPISQSKNRFLAVSAPGNPKDFSGNCGGGGSGGGAELPRHKAKRHFMKISTTGTRQSGLTGGRYSTSRSSPSGSASPKWSSFPSVKRSSLPSCRNWA